MEAREPRKIRMSEIEWEAFKKLLGPRWLREQIQNAMRKDIRRMKADERERGMTE